MKKRFFSAIIALFITLVGYAQNGKFLELPVLYVYDYMYNGPARTYDGGKVVFERSNRDVITYIFSPGWQDGKEFVAMKITGQPGLSRNYIPDISNYTTLLYAGRMYQLITKEPNVPGYLQIYQAGSLSEGGVFSPIYICICIGKYGKTEAIATLQYSEKTWNELIEKVYNASYPMR